MEKRYKLTLFNKNLYKEVELSAEMAKVKIGTTVGCDVRLHKYFDDFEMTLELQDGKWIVTASDNIYFNFHNNSKKLTAPLHHGDVFHVRYEKADLFSCRFLLDFDYEKKNYDLMVDISKTPSVTIGAGGSHNIVLNSPYVTNDSIVLQQTKSGLLLQCRQSKYGVLHNGKPVSGEVQLRDYDFFSIADFSFYYKKGRLYTEASDKLKINQLSSSVRTAQHKTSFKYPKFIRNSRVQYVIPKDELEIQQPIAMPTRPKKSLILSLIPSLVMLAMTVVLRGILGGGGSFVIYSAISMSMGIAMSIVTYIRDKKDYEAEFKQRINSYNDYIEEKRSDIEISRKNELRIRNLIYESLENSISEVNSFGRRLFEKSQGDMDFLHVYLGKGRIESSSPVKYNKQEFVNLEDPLDKMSERIAEGYRFIDEAPIVSDFFQASGIGIVGSLDNRKKMLKNIILDIAIRHFYHDVKMFFVFSDDFRNHFRWVRWLQNVQNQQFDVKNIICDEESKTLLLEDLYVILLARENMKTKDVVFDCQYVIFITDTSVIATHPILKYQKTAAQYGFTFVYLDEYEERIPQGCAEMIRLLDSNTGELVKFADGDNATLFIYPDIPDVVAESIALRLGAVEVDEVSLESALTKSITLFELLGIYSIEDLDLTERWGKSQVYRSMAVPLGVKSKNQLVSLDISDKAGAHGPHGLVAGTTGSGKSEVLQTYILSMVTLFSPSDVGFVLIDFKGGGMANQFKKLPHLIGTITNIDGREINRSLLSIKAELVKRQEIFSKHGVNHINDYIKLYKANKAETALPHLIMIVDEFAELKAEYPDFMKELISAARIGRTLGVHLILATQKPAGVVDAQIWSNSKFKLCLKVQTKEDSNEVIKTPLAAEIVEPGRAYFQVGNNEIFDLFQSAYSGATVPDGSDLSSKTYSIYEQNDWGKKTLRYTNKKEKTDKESVSQLQAIVEYVSAYCKVNGIKSLPGICLPSLSDRISTDTLDYTVMKDVCRTDIAIGIYDDPEQQRQGEVVLELSKDNTYIVGSSQSGKTMLLQTIAYGLIKKYSPKEVNLYMIDCGSMVLKIFEDSVHVGGVVLSNEEEKCKNLFKMLGKLTIKRKKQLSSAGVGNYASYLEAGYHDMPLAVVMVDNMAAFKEYFPDQADDINSLAREAQGVGISFIITAVNSNALSYRAQANFGEKLVLNCNDSSEYSNIFGHCKNTPKENPGRGLLLLDKRILEFQAAIIGQSTKEAERSKEIRQYIAERNGECQGKAVPIPMIPAKLPLADCMDSDPELFRNRGILPIAMSFVTVDYTYFNLNNNGSLVLLGEDESRITFLKRLMHMLSQTIIYHNIEAIVIDDKTKRLKACSSYGFVKHYTNDAAEALSHISDYCDDVMDRYNDDEGGENYLMLVINSADVLRRIMADKNESKALSEVIKNADKAGAFLVFNGFENQPIGFNSSEILKTLKEQRQGILFAPLAESKMYEIPARTKPDSDFDSTMGYRFDGGTFYKIKIFS